MGTIFVWIILLAIVLIIRKKNREKEEKLNRIYAERFSKGKDTDNSYYSREKVEKYRKMNEDHLEHDEDFLKTTSEIGYKRCPVCGAMVSKKADVCFMCNSEFPKNGQ